MAKNYDNILRTVKANIDAYLNTARTALKSNKLDAYENAKVDLEASIEDLNNKTREAAYEKLMAEDDPLMAAIRQFYVTSYRIKELKGKEGEDKGKTIDLSVVPNEKTRIDFDDFCEYAKIDREWLRDCTNLLALLQLRKTDIYKLNLADLSAENYYFKEAFKKKKAGETPDSNTKIVAALQGIVDATIFEDNGKKENVHKCTHRDIAFIEDCAHQFDPKAVAGIKSMKPKAFKTVMASVLHKILTGKEYTVKNYEIKH